VRVGRNVAILDNAMVTGSCDLGDDVVIAPGALVSSATIGEGSMVGMGAKVLPGARVGSDCFVDAGAVVGEGTVVPSGQLWTGAPARFLRALSPAEMSYLRSSALSYAELGAQHRAEGAKSAREVEEGEELRWAKIEGGYAPNTPVSTEDPDVIQYYKLTAKHANPGLWRETETDSGVEVARKEADEMAADRREEAHYNFLASKKRVAEALGALVVARPAVPAERESIMGNLERRDAEGASMLANLMQRAGAATDPLEKEELLRIIRSLNPASASEFAPAALAALAQHSTAARL
jgi:hypothetical protein